MHFNEIEKKVEATRVNSLEKVRCVVGGPCICFSKGNPWRLTLQDLIDCFVPCLYALKHTAPLYVYFQAYESDIMADVLVFDPKQADYHAMKNFLMIGLKRVLKLLDYPEPEIFFIDTQESVIKERIDFLEKRLTQTLSADNLYGLYSVVKGGHYPKGCKEEEIMLQVYRRNLSLYLNDFFDALTEFSGEQRLVVENTTQKKALVVAGIGHSQEKTAAILYPPAPNCKAIEMNLGNRNHKIDLRLDAKQVEQRVQKLFSENKNAKNYYETIFAGVPIETVMQEWKDACHS